MSQPIRQTVLRFGPDRRLVAGCGVAALIAAVAALVGSDPEARFLAGGAALLLAAYAITGLAFHPRLVASAAGIRVHTPARRATLSWSEIRAITAVAARRLHGATLEVDAEHTLVVFSRWSLGADPRRVAGLINALDPRRAGSR